MSDLDEFIERVGNEQFDRNRMVCVVEDQSGEATVDDVKGIDIVVKAPGDEVALVARVSWGDGDIAADLSVFVDGALTNHDGIALEGTTSIWATKEA